MWIDPEGLYNHNAPGYLLSKYGDRDVGYAHSAELESGWDFTSRFYNRCNEFLPVDLNAYLFKYESDFAKIALHLGDISEHDYWRKRSQVRSNEINNLMWNDKVGFYFDYNVQNNRKSNFYSLAGFVPLWTEQATETQAEKIVRHVKKFETKYGLTITTKASLAPKIELNHIPNMYKPAIQEIIEPKQWDYPYSWPPLEYLTTIGLLKYGYVDDAKRLMEKYLSTHAGIFRKYGTFYEKINALTGDISQRNFHYVSQSGFGWTNAIFYRYTKLLDGINSGKVLYHDAKTQKPPFRIGLPH